MDSELEIIAFVPCKLVLGRMNVLQDVLSQRGARQFGYQLSDEENISQGIREGMVQGEGQYTIAAPTAVYRKDKTLREIDGITLELAAPGETDDQLLVWLPALIRCSAVATTTMATGRISMPSAAVSTGISALGAIPWTSGLPIRRIICCPAIPAPSSAKTLSKKP